MRVPIAALMRVTISASFSVSVTAATAWSLVIDAQKPLQPSSKAPPPSAANGMSTMMLM
jgi:hypothetical protein